MRFVFSFVCVFVDRFCVVFVVVVGFFLFWLCGNRAQSADGSGWEEGEEARRGVRGAEGRVGSATVHLQPLLPATGSEVSVQSKPIQNQRSHCH